MKKMVKKGMSKVVEEDFSSVFEIISRRRSRASKAAYGGTGLFQLPTGKSDVVRSAAGGVDIFQSVTGKCMLHF